MRPLLVTILILSFGICAAQNVGINATGAAPDASALLDISASGAINAGGLLIPRMSTIQRNTIPSPAISLLIFNTTTSQFEWYDGGAWIALDVPSSGTLDEAYDFGGTGAGNTIQATDGPLHITGTDGLVSTGMLGNGVQAPVGSGTRLVWNPHQAAFRAGEVTFNEWDPSNMGEHSFASGFNTLASGSYSNAMGQNTEATGSTAMVWGAWNNATGDGSTVFGFGNSAVGEFGTAWGFEASASGEGSTAFGLHASASGEYATSFGDHSFATGDFSFARGEYATASGDLSTVSGDRNTASGKLSSASGMGNEAPSFAETVIGIGASSYTLQNAALSSTQEYPQDRLFTIGNGADANNNGLIDAGERSDAMVVLKSGNVGLGASIPTNTLHINGGIRYEDGMQSSGFVLTSDANGNATWTDPALLAISTTSWGLNGNNGTSLTTDFIGTLDNEALAFRTNNAEHMRLSNSGNLGVGNMNPQEKLHVAGSIRMVDGNQAAGRVLVSDVNGTGSWQALTGWELTGNSGTSPSTDFIGTSDNQALAFRTNNAERMRISNTGNLGVGNLNPQEKLHVSGSIRMVDGNQATGRVLVSDANGTGSWQTLPAPSGWDLTGNTGTNTTSNFIGTTNNVGLAFRTNNNERLRISSSGLVGIGTNVPSRLLHLNQTTTSTSSGQLYLRQSGSGDATLHFGLGASIGRHYNIGIDNSDADKFKIGTSATSAAANSSGTLLTLNISGDLGLGTNNPGTDLEVAGSGDQTIRIASNLSSAGSAGLEFLRTASGLAMTDWRVSNDLGLLEWKSSSNNLVSTTTRLQLSTQNLRPAIDGGMTLGISSRRWSLVYAQNGTINTSDKRDKENIEPIAYGLSTVKKLKPVSYNWKEQPEYGKKLGLIAQDLESVIPEVVQDWEWQEDEQGERFQAPAERLGVYYSDLIPVLIKAIQELEQQVSALEQQLEKQ